MFYIAADDSLLERFGIDSFNELARIGSTDRVHLVALLDRVHSTKIKPVWSETRRFFIQRGRTLEVEPGTPAPDCPNAECDMGSPQTLASFLEWAEKEHAAKHYALIIWGHGVGFTYESMTPPIIGTVKRRGWNPLEKRVEAFRLDGQLRCEISAFAPPKGIATDQTDRSTLRNRNV